MLRDLFFEQILPALLTAAGACAVAALGTLAAYLRARAAAVGAASTGGKVLLALEQLDVMAQNTVAHLNAETKDKLVRYLADGVLTDAEKADLKATAMAQLTSDAGPAMELLKKQFAGAFDTVVSGAIERAVQQANETKGVAK